jgi:hypothetical protein
MTHCLFKPGVCLGEIWYLSKPADRPHLPGRMGPPANAVATV